MPPEPDDELLRLVRRIMPEGKLLRAWPLKGGVSAQVTALEITQPGGRIEKLVVRRHGERDLARNPQVAAGELALLQILQTAGVAAPRPLALDQLGHTPVLVIEYVERETVFAPSDLDNFLTQMAAHLAKIHAIDGRSVRFLPRIQAGVARSPVVLLHGDYWPGNVLWRDGRLVAVIDWEDAAIGDPLADLGNARLEIFWAFGDDAMRRFTEHYRLLTAVDLARLPHWDLWAARRAAGKLSAWQLDPTTEQAMRQKLAPFIERACEQLPVR